MEGNVPPDPGWRPAVAGAGRAMVPGAGQRSASGTVGVVTLRAVFVSFAVAVLLFLVVLVFVLPTGGDDGGRPSWPWLLPGGLGVASLVVSLALARRPLPCTGADEVAQAYVRRFFLQLAFGELPALLGFVAAFLVGTRWPYVLGLGLTAVAFARAAPTAGRLQAVDEDLVAQGCPHGVRAVLYRSSSEAGG